MCDNKNPNLSNEETKPDPLAQLTPEEQERLNETYTTIGDDSHPGHVRRGLRRIVDEVSEEARKKEEAEKSAKNKDKVSDK